MTKDVLWTEGVCEDGAAILRDGIMMPVEYVVRTLNELQSTLKAMVDEQVEYMTINHLGDPEKQHNIKRARIALAKHDE